MPNFLPLIQLRLTMRYNKFIAGLQKIPLLVLFGLGLLVVLQMPLILK